MVGEDVIRAIELRRDRALLNADPRLMAGFVKTYRGLVNPEAKEAVELLDMVSKMVVTLANDVQTLLEERAHLQKELDVYRLLESYVDNKQKPTNG